MYLSLNSIILLYYLCIELDVNEFEVLIVANVLSSMHAFRTEPKDAEFMHEHQLFVSV